MYDYVKYRSGAEKEFIERLEASKEVAVYVKLPEQFVSPLLQNVICRNGRSLCTGKRKENVSLLLGKKPEKIEDSNQSKIAENIKDAAPLST